MKNIKSFESLSFNTPLDNNYFGESEGEERNYMFFQNLKNSRDMIDLILSMDPSIIDTIIDDGHDWASDHISIASENIEQVHSFLNGYISKPLDKESEDE